LDLKHLRFFCLVAELEHVTQAADKLMVSQPYLTQMINNIEEELGVDLFDHVGRKIKLNQLGIAFYVRSKKLLQDFEDAQIELKELAQHEERKVSIITNVGLYMPDLLESFHQHYPETIIYQSSARRKDIIASLDAGLVDFAICTPPIEEDEETSIKTQIVFTDESSVLCSPGHPLIKKGCILLEDLENEKLITSPVGFGMRDQIDMVFAQAKIHPRIVIESSDTSAVPEYVKAGLGFAIIPKSYKLKNSALEPYCVEVANDNTPGYIGLSWNKNRYKKKMAITLGEFIIDYFANLSETIHLQQQRNQQNK